MRFFARLVSVSRIIVLPAAVVLAVVVVGFVALGCGTSTSSESTSPSPSSGGSATGTWTPADLAALQVDPAAKALLPAGMTEIRCASDIPYPPYEYYDPATSKNLTGSEYDLAQAIGKKLGVPALFYETPFDTIILAIKADKYDMIAGGGMYDLKSREEAGITYVDYGYESSAMLVKKGNPEGISDVNSLSGKTVACEAATTEQALLQGLNKKFVSEGKQPVHILVFTKQAEALLAVTAGRAIGDMTGHGTAMYIAMTTNNGNEFEVVKDPSAPKGYEPAYVGYGFLSTSTLADAVQKALQDLIDGGAYQKMMQKYGMLPLESAMINAATRHPIAASP